jgi:4-phytase/acid phosphatase
MRIAAAVLLALLAAPAAAGAAPAKPDPALERVVLVERHGVRSPTRAPEALARYASQPWHAWPVAPGLLTDHGRRDVELMGAWLRADYARKGLWPASGPASADAIYVWADAKDQRTRASGQALVDGAFPGSGLKDAFGPQGMSDQAFDAVSTGACPLDLERARKAVVAEAGGDLDNPRPDYRAALAALTAVLKPGTRPDPGAHNTATPGDKGQLRYAGPLADAATSAENVYLEYVQGFPLAEVGWGRASSPALIAGFMPMHDISFDLSRRTPYLAEHYGAVMMRDILAALQGRAALPGQARPARMAVFAGHDSNLANMAGFLGLRWTLPDQPDDTAPDTVLAFEVWKAKSGQRYVRAAVIYQTIEELRNQTRLDAAHPAGRVALAVPGCADGPGGACRLATFETLIARRLPPECAQAARAP